VNGGRALMIMEARRQSVSVPHHYMSDLAGIQAPVILTHGPYNRMVVPFEVSFAILNHIADRHLVLLNNSGHWPTFEHMDRAGPRVPAGLLNGTVRAKTRSICPSRLESWMVRQDSHL
jgi:pimeloyl-ACP methyl ester carboxylesterase